MNPSPQSSAAPNPIASPVARVSGRVTAAPNDYSGLDYVDQAKDLRQVAHGSWHDWAQVLPRQEGPHQLVSSAHPVPTSRGNLHVDTKSSMETINAESRMSFLKECSGRMSSFIKDRVLQDVLHGMNDVSSPIKNGLAVAVGLGLPALQEEAVTLMGNKFRPGKCNDVSSDDKWNVRFGEVAQNDKVVNTAAVILGRKWHILDFGDAIPGTREGPINDVLGEIISERNQCLATHLAAGHIPNKPDQQVPPLTLK